MDSALLFSGGEVKHSFQRFRPESLSGMGMSGESARSSTILQNA